MLRKRSTVVAVVVALAALLASACSGGGSDESGTGGTDVTSTVPDEPVRGGTLIYGVGAETNGWNPATDRWATAGTQVARSFYEPLLTYDADYEPAPYLAESVVANDDYTEWTITTREGINFHDGTPFDAAAVAANLQARVDSPLTGLALGLVTGIEVLDDRTVVVRLDAPWPHFPQILTGQGGMMAAPATLSDPDGGRNPIGTGPFVFVEWIPDNRLRVERNDDYWQEGYPLLDAIEFRPLTDNDARMATFDAGDLDINPTAVARQIIRLEEEAAQGDVQLWLDDESESLENFTLLNMNEPPFDDLRARQALAYATDKEGLIDVLFDGRFEPANGLFAPNSPWYTETDTIQWDPDRARELVAEYEADVGPIEFDFLGTSNVEDVRIREVLQAQWATVGINARLDNYDAGTQIVRLLTGDYQVGNFALFTSQNPDSDYHFLHSSTLTAPGEIGLNVVGIDSAELDGALDTARASDDSAVVREQWGIVNQILADEVPMIFLWHSLTGLAAQNNVRDVTTFTLPDGQPGLGLFGVFHPMQQIWLAPD